MNNFFESATMNSHTKQCRKKFTLIELLIVIAIIAILAGLLLPAMEMARKRAFSVQCVGNVKQMGTAIFSYSCDYNDFIPPARTSEWLTENGFGFWRIWISCMNPYLTNGKNWDGGRSKTSKVFFCPSGEKEVYQYNGYDFTSYMYNGRIGDATYTTNTDYFMRKMNRCKQPSRCVLLTDGKCKSTGSWGCGFLFAVAGRSNAISYLPQRHPALTDTTLYADGHIESIKTRQVSDADLLKYYSLYPASSIWP